MKVLFDPQIFYEQAIGGISRYHYELLKGLPSQGVDCELAIRFSNNYYLKNKDVSNHHTLFPDFNLKIRNNYIRKSNERYCLERLVDNKYDIFHPTYYEEYFINKLNRPMVLTIHDMTLEKFNPNDHYISMKQDLIKRADKIIAISENTKKDLMDLLHIDGGKIEIIHHGNNINLDIKQQKPSDMIDNPYLLYVGGRGGYKNSDMLLRVFSKISRKYKNLNLIFTGNPFSIDEKKFITSLNIEDKVSVRRVTDNELIYLYNKAIALVYPSLYEGFGMPILEAFSCKCPVILSNCSCFPEIASDAGIYFDPAYDDSLYMQIENIINTGDRENIIRKGCIRSKDFSWQRSCKETASLYRSLL